MQTRKTVICLPLTVIALTAALSLPWTVASAGASWPMIEQVSVDSNEAVSQGISGSPDLSEGGRYVAFTSDDESLAPEGQRFEWVTIFLRDVKAGVTHPVSLSRSGKGPTHESFDPQVSSDGRFVLFHSDATNLVWNQRDAEDGSSDIFLRDMERQRNVLITRAPDGHAVGGAFNHDISPDGNTIVFDSRFPFVPDDHDAYRDVYSFNRKRKEYSLVSKNRTVLRKLGDRSVEANSFGPAPSWNGRHTAFDSESNNLVPNDSNEASDIFVRDRRTGSIERVSVSSGGEQGDSDSLAAKISGDGRYVVFMSDATDLIDNDTNGMRDIFVHDRQTGKTRRVSQRPGGAGGNRPSFDPSISSDGRSVTFRSYASNLSSDDTGGTDDLDVFLADLESREVRLVTRGCSGDSRGKDAVVSRLGRRVAFVTTASDLASGDAGGDLYDVYLRRMSGGCSG